MPAAREYFGQDEDTILPCRKRFYRRPGSVQRR